MNVTLTNQADHVDLAPLLHLGFSEWVSDGSPGPEYGDDLELGKFGGYIRKFNQRDTYYSNSKHPTPNRYWDYSVVFNYGLKPTGSGPANLVQPGQSVSMEFGFLVSQRRTGDEGYFVLDFNIVSQYPEGESVSWNKSSGCFNDSIAEFYGAPGDRIDCPWYDETRRDTDTGMELWGQKFAAKPFLIHDVAREW